MARGGELVLRQTQSERPRRFTGTLRLVDIGGGDDIRRRPDLGQ